MSQAGWYPDPGGQAGMFRYWDGTSWSAATSPNPSAPPPSQGLVSQPSQKPSGQNAGGQLQGAAPYGTSQPQTSAYANYQQTQKKKSSVGWWIGAGALVLVLAIVGVLAIRQLGGGNNPLGQPGGNSSSDICPVDDQPVTAAPQRGDGRVHGGPVSYPELGSPWGAPQPEDRVAFGRDVVTQNVTIEENYEPGRNWVASVLVGELVAGDGFYGPQAGAELVVKCVVGSFYGDAEVGREDLKSEAATIDGHDAWIVESHLTFDIEGLETKGELLILAVITVGANAGIYYASIPDTSKELVKPARQALKDLKVDS